MSTCPCFHLILVWIDFVTTPQMRTDNSSWSTSMHYIILEHSICSFLHFVTAIFIMYCNGLSVSKAPVSIFPDMYVYVVMPFFRIKIINTRCFVKYVK